MKYGGMYWNIKKILPYQRHFNFINSTRSIGKSYTTAGFFIDRFFQKQEEFIFITRTMKERDKGALRNWFKKVVAREFKGYDFRFTNDTMYFANFQKKTEWIPMGYCVALNEVIDVKKRSYENVKWMVLEEYMLEPKNQDLYVKGWHEPNLVLNLYHTVDREEDNVVMFFLGNNTAFYNPYHLHTAFQIPPGSPGETWYSDNVLFQWALPSAELQEKKSKSKFLNMIKDTEYGEYAYKGNYIGDNTNFVAEKSNKAVFVFTFQYDGEDYGVWNDYRINRVFISKKANQNKVKLVLDNLCQEGDILVNKRHSLIKWLAKRFSMSCVYYESMELKLKCEKIIVEKMV